MFRDKTFSLFNGVSVCVTAAVKGSGRLQTTSQPDVLDSKNLRIKVHPLSAVVIMFDSKIFLWFGRSSLLRYP